jgi:hypothetical protein
MLPVDAQDTVQEFLHGVMTINLCRVGQVQHVKHRCLKNAEAAETW